MARALLLLASLAALTSWSGCRALGFSDRVLLRVPSPDGAVVAVCQEVPAFDGPGYDVRLERADGTPVRRLYEIGDGDPCSEIAWSADGRTLAVLSGHVARFRIVDVAWALSHPDTRTAYWSWRQIDLSSAGELRMGREMRFVSPQELQLTLCAASPPRRHSPPACTSPDVRKRIRIPTPIVTGHRS